MTYLNKKRNINGQIVDRVHAGREEILVYYSIVGGKAVPV
jgi:hypothetical protein